MSVSRTNHSRAEKEFLPLWKWALAQVNPLIEKLPSPQQFSVTNRAFQVEPLSLASSEWRRFLPAFVEVRQRRLMQENVQMLDLGALFGVFPLLCTQLGVQVTVVDDHSFYGEQMQSFRQLWELQGIRFLNLNLVGESLPFRDQSFDIVTLLAVVEHLPHSHKNVLKQIHRVLKED